MENTANNNKTISLVLAIVKLVLAVVFLVFTFFVPAEADGEIQISLFFLFQLYLAEFHPFLPLFILFLLVTLLVIIKNILLLVGVLKDKDVIALTKANISSSLILASIFYFVISAILGFYNTFHPYVALVLLVAYTIVKKILEKKLNIGRKKK